MPEEFLSKSLITRRIYEKFLYFFFYIYNFITIFTPTGFTEDHKFVKYFNEYNSKNNKNTEIKNSENININHLIDSPYNGSINKDKKSININLASLKNFKTSEYGYNVK